MSITINNLTKNFGRKVLFKNFSLEFDDNGTYAIMGESGTGKTTLLRMLAGLDKIYEGDIVFNSSSKVSMVFQEHRLFPNLNALDNVLVAAFDEYSSEDLEATKSFLKRLRFNDNDMLLYPDELSGGMKQRISLARGILRESDVILLDEPTKELDMELRETLYDIINEIARTKLVVISTHSNLDVTSTNAKIININTH